MDKTTLTVTNSDNTAPSLVEVVRKDDDDQSVILFFDKVMDENSIINASNYYIVTGEGESKKLPSDCKIYANSDLKSVTIEFPSSYTIGTEKYDNYIKKVGVSDVKAKDGTPLVGLYFCDKISSTSSNGPSLIDGSGKLAYEGDNIKITLSLTAPLDILNVNDFKVSGKTPDSGRVSGSDVILTFKAGVKDNDKIDAINSNSTSTTVNISNPTSVDVAGRKLKSGSDILLMPPKTVPSSWSARGGYTSSVSIVFNQDIDDNIEQSYNDDFIFTDITTGEKLTVSSVAVNDETVVFKFANNSIKVGDKISIEASSDASTLSIRGEEDDDDYAIYSPTKTDLQGRTITAK
jgi:hypothetical protein